MQAMMKERVKGLKEEEVASRIRLLLGMSGSTVKVAFERRFPGRRLVGGKYNPSSRTITIYLDTIREQCLQLYGTELYADAFAAVIFAHELGHAEDAQLASLSAQLDEPDLSRMEKRRIALKIEQNAWVYASKLLSDWRCQILFPEIVYHSLAPYYNALVPPAPKKPGRKKQPATA